MDPQLMRNHTRVRHEDKTLCSRYYDEKELIELDIPIELYIVDISAGGVGVKSFSSISKGNILIFELPFGLSTYKVMGKVMWVDKREDCYRGGLEFVSLPFSLKESLIELSKLGEESPLVESY